jgi:hypothetical protein
MDRPLPVFAVVGRALWFVIANVFTLFRLTWLPLAALVAAGYGLAYGVVQQSPGMTFDKVAEQDVYFHAEIATLLLQGLALSVVAVHVHRIILFGERMPNVYFAFPFGRTEFLYVLMGALTYFVLIVLLGFLVLGILALMIGVGTGQDTSRVFAAMMAVAEDMDASPALIAGAIFAALFVYILMIWIMLRLTVWPPAVVANNRLALGEALRLTKGRVWALLGLMIASSIVFIPILVVIAAWAYKVKAGDSFELIVAGSLEGKVKHLLSGSVTPNVIVYEFVFQFLATSYTVAVLSYAYRALKGLDGERPIDQQTGEPADDPILHMKPLGAH